MVNWRKVSVHVNSYVGRLRSTVQFGFVSLEVLCCFKVSQLNPWMQFEPPTIKQSSEETMLCNGLVLMGIVLLGVLEPCVSSPVWFSPSYSLFKLHFRKALSTFISWCFLKCLLENIQIAEIRSSCQKSFARRKSLGEDRNIKRTYVRHL